MNAVQELGCKNFLKLLASKYNARVVVGGDYPCTTSSRVCLPDMKNH